MKLSTHKVILACLVVAPPILATLVELATWNKNPPVGEINGIPSAVFVIFTIPAIVASGIIGSFALKLIKKGSPKNYLKAFIFPSAFHALFFAYLTIHV